MWHQFKLAATKWFIRHVKSDDGLFATTSRISCLLHHTTGRSLMRRTLQLRVPALPSPLCLFYVSLGCFIFPQECCNSLPILPNPSASALPHHQCHSPWTPHHPAEAPRWAASALFSRQHWVLVERLLMDTILVSVLRQQQPGNAANCGFLPVTRRLYMSTRGNSR